VILARSIEEIREILGRRGLLTRPELAEALAAKGIPVQGQAIAHLVAHAALQGVICFGPELEGVLTYVLLEDWVKTGEKLDGEKALAELVRRYLGAYGPATPADFAGWAGISMGQARSGFEAISEDLLEVRFPESAAWMLKQNQVWLEMLSENPVLHLLPRFDNYLLGYQSRDFMVPDRYAKQVHPGGGMLKATVILDGLAVGNWKVERKKSRATAVIQPFEPLPAEALPLLETEAQDLGRFLEEDMGLRIEQIE
jgi:hypothetical protein